MNLQRKETEKEGRWKYFTREEILENKDNLDMTWLENEELEEEEEILEADFMTEEIISGLKAALDSMEEISNLLDN